MNLTENNMYDKIVVAKTEIDTETMDSLCKKDWFKIVRRENSALWDSLVRVGGTSDNPEFGFKNSMPHFFAYNHEVYSLTNEFEDFKNIFIEKSKSDVNFLDTFFSRLEKDCDDLEKITVEIQMLDVQKLSDNELGEQYDIFVKQCLKILTYIWPPLCPEDWIIQHITESLSSKISPVESYDELKYVVEILTTSTVSSPVQEREEAILKLALEVQDIDLDKEKIMDVYQKYAWTVDSCLKFSYETYDQFISSLQEKMASDSQVNLEIIQNNRKQLEKEKEDMIKKYDIDESIVTYANQAAKLPHWRLLRTERPVESFYQLQNFIQEIGKRIGADDVTLFYYWEISNALKGENLPMEKINARKTGFTLMITDSDIYDLDSDTGERIFKTIDEPKSVVNTIRGNTACKGFVTAVVQVIESPKAIQDFKEGNILVTSMTTPEFVPIMKMASAIITDEGGISCHAAIVSRELRVPCVIGTQSATKILKDGDRVEVDADNGVVKIL